MYEKFEKKIDELKHLINGKKVILWGYGIRGKLFENILQIHHRRIDAIVDREDYLPDIKAKTMYALDYYDPASTVILFMPNIPVSTIEPVLKEHGFDVANVIHLVSFFYGDKGEGRNIDYYHWAEYEFGVDLCKGKDPYREQRERIHDQGELCHSYWPFSGTMLKTVLTEFCFGEEDAVFDYGCGKGGALTMFYDAGVRRIGGIEFDRELYDTACKNMDKLHIRHNIVCGDAAEYKEIDSYNIFYLFDPFEGEIFEKVIENMERSFLRNRRKIIIIYAAPRCHKAVIKNGVFKYTQQFETFHCFTKATNVYISSDGI